jgi:hypothetical protein
MPADTNDSLATQVGACEALHGAAGSVVAIRRWPNECYTVAGRLRGRYTCMEEMDCKDLLGCLLGCAASIEAVTGVPRCAAVFDLIDRCMTGIATPLRTIRKTVASGRLPQPHRLLKHRDVGEAVVEVATAATVVAVPKLLGNCDIYPLASSSRRYAFCPSVISCPPPDYCVPHFLLRRA